MTPTLAAKLTRQAEREETDTSEIVKRALAFYMDVVGYVHQNPRRFALVEGYEKSFAVSKMVKYEE